ncbi:MAG: efflux RND transporter periplasmic adaptor subunit [Polyangiaceae bacterium]
MIHDDPLSADARAGSQPRRSFPVAGAVLVTLAALAVGAGVWLAHKRRVATADAAAAAASAAANRMVPVVTAPVTTRDVPVWLEGLGTVSAFYTVTVKPQADGRIDRVLFTEGQAVKKGDVLVQIDPRPYRIQLESAQAALARDAANLKNTRLNLERYKTLSAQNLIPVQQMTDQQASVDQLASQMQADQAQIDAAKLNIDFAQVKSPIDGVTGVRLVDPGNVVHQTDTTGLVVVTQLDPISVFFTLPEDDLHQIQKAMALGALTVEALSRDGDKPLGEGKLSVIDNQINQATATVRLKAIFDNGQRQLWPNQFVKARLRVTTRKDALVVPAAVVQHGPQGTFAYVVGPDSRVAPRPIEVDTVQGDLALLGKGVNAGEVVVVEGQGQLRPGSKVAPKGTERTGPGPSAPKPPEGAP